MNSLNDSLILRPLVLEDEQAFLLALNAWDLSPGFTFALGYRAGMSFSNYLDLIDANERGEQLPAGFVSSTVLGGFVGAHMVGRVSFRHTLNDFLFKIGGHIGYGVVPKFRRLGYATEMLSQALLLAPRFNIKNVLLTCDDNNVGSIKTIEACGGVLENKIVVAPDQPLKRRYWIKSSL